MNKKLTYSSPETEIVELAFGENCLVSLSDSTKALSNSSVEEATDYNDGNVINW